MDTFALEPFNSIYYFEKHYGTPTVATPEYIGDSINMMIVAAVVGVILLCIICHVLRRPYHDKLM